MARVGLPIQEAVRDLTTDLLGRGTAVDKSPDPVDPADVGAVVAYRDDAGVVAIVGVFDSALVGILGAALVMMPVSALDEAKRLGELPENIVENFWEVANIVTSMLNRPGRPHLVLADKHVALDDAAEDLRAAIDSPTKARAFNVSVEGYGTGRMSLYAA